jgi:hypothetical protein
MAARYWVGNTGNWNTSSNWSTSSGGSGGASVPTVSDDVYFDANSFNADSQVVTIDANAECLDMDWTGLDQSVSLSNTTYTIYIQGSLTLHANLTWDFDDSTPNRLLQLTATDSRTITTNGCVIVGSFEMDGVGGTWTLQDDFECDSFRFYLTNGHLDLNDFDFTMAGDNFMHTDTGTKELSMGSGTLHTGYFYIGIAASGLTVNRETGTLSVGTAVLQLAEQDWYNIVCSSVASLNISSNSPITIHNDFTITGASNRNCFVNIDTDFTVTGTLTLTGYNAQDARLIVRSEEYRVGPADRPTITCNGTLTVSNTDFIDIEGAGSVSWDLSGATGGTGLLGSDSITGSTPATLYFVHTSGDVSFCDSTKWSTTSGGTTGARVPLIQDTAIFDGNSFTGSVSNFSLNRFNMPTVDMSKVDQNISVFWYYGWINFYGSFLTSSTVTRYSWNNNTHFLGTGDHYIYHGTTFSYQATVYIQTGGQGTVTLLSDIDVVNINPSVSNGAIFYQNGYTITASGTVSGKFNIKGDAGLGAESIPNTDFSGTGSPWSFSSSSWSLVDNKAYFDNTGNGHIDLTEAQMAESIIEGERYRWQFDLILLSGANAYIRLEDNGGGVIVNPWGSSITATGQYSIDFNCATGGGEDGLWVYGTSGGGAYYLDNISIRAIAGSTVSATLTGKGSIEGEPQLGEQMLSNGDFSSGQTDWDWNIYWDLVDGRAYYTDDPAGAFAQIGQLAADMVDPITPNTKYKLIFDLEVDGINQAYMRFRSIDNEQYIPITFYDTGSQSINFTTPSDIGTGGFEIYAVGSAYDSGADAFYIDDILVKPFVSAAVEGTLEDAGGGTSSISGDITSDSTVSGTLTGTGTLAGDITSDSTVSGTLVSQPSQISGDITSDTTVSGTLTAKGNISGEANAKSEQVTDSSFDNASAWVNATSRWTISGGQASYDNTSFGALSQRNTGGESLISPLTSNTTYLLNFTVISSPSPYIWLRLYNFGITALYLAGDNYAPGDYTLQFTTPDDIGGGGISLQAWGDEVGVIDDLSIKELSGTAVSGTLINGSDSAIEGDITSTTTLSGTLTGTGNVFNSLVINGDFSAEGDWYTSFRSSITGGKLVMTSGGSAIAYYGLSTTFNEGWYKVRFTIDSISTGELTVLFNDSTGYSYNTNTAGTYTIDLYCDSNGQTLYFFGAGTDAVIDDVYLWETNRTELSAALTATGELVGATTGETTLSASMASDGAITGAITSTTTLSGTLTGTGAVSSLKIINGTFDSEDNWNTTSRFTIAGGKAVFINTGAAIGSTDQRFPYDNYIVTFTIDSISSGTVRPVFSSAAAQGTFRDTAGTYTEIIPSGSGGTSIFALQSLTGTDAVIDNVQIYPFTGATVSADILPRTEYISANLLLFSFAFASLTGHNRIEGVTTGTTTLSGTLTGTGNLLGDIAALKENIVVNGTFDTDTDWTKGSGWAISSGYASRSSSGIAGVLTQSGLFTIGESYCLKFTVLAIIDNITLGPQRSITIGAAGDYFIKITAVLPDLFFSALPETAVVIDNVEVWEIGGSTVEGTLEAVGANPISGDITTDTTVSGTLTGTGALVGTSAGTCSMEGTVEQDPGIIFGSTSASTTVEGTLTATGSVLGDLSGSTVLTGVIIGRRQISGNIPTAATVTGSLDGVSYMTGDASGSAALSNTITGTGYMTAEIAATALADGTLVGGAQISAATDGVALVTSTLYDAAALYIEYLTRDSEIHLSLSRDSEMTLQLTKDSQI